MSSFDRIAQSLLTLTTAPTPPSLAELAREADLSPFHFQRTFQRLVGLSPLRLHQLVSVEAAKEALTSSRSVLEAAWDAGLSGPSRLHDAMLRLERMTPGEFKAGPRLRWTKADTELGTLTIAATERGLCGITFSGLDALTPRWPGSSWTRDDRGLAQHVSQLERLLAGKNLSKPLSVILRGTDLQVAVWRALLELPPGAVCTYTSLAERVGKPRAVRAVASAVAANELAWLIPCHRVIRSTGVLGGYRWGPARKSVLLARELASAR